MKLAVFGGTGPTGQLLVGQALDAGHEVTAYARNPSTLADRAGLTVIKGQLDDADAVVRTVEGADAVVSLLGPGRDKTDSPAIVTGIANIITATRTHDVSRIVALSTPSSRDPADSRDVTVTAMITLVKLTQRHAYDAIRTGAQLIRDSDLDWTLVRVPLLHDGPATDTINARYVGQGGGWRLSRTNAAAFILAQTDSTTTWLRTAPYISDT